MWLSEGSSMMFVLKLKAKVLNKTIWDVGWKRKMGQWTMLQEVKTVCISQRYCLILLQINSIVFLTCAAIFICKECEQYHVSLQEIHWQSDGCSHWPTLCVFSLVSVTCGPSRSQHCQHQRVVNSGRRNPCVWAQLAPVALCLWGTSWVLERMN